MVIRIANPEDISEAIAWGRGIAYFSESTTFREAIAAEHVGLEQSVKIGHSYVEEIEGVVARVLLVSIHAVAWDAYGLIENPLFSQVTSRDKILNALKDDHKMFGNGATLYIDV